LNTEESRADEEVNSIPVMDENVVTENDRQNIMDRLSALGIPTEKVPNKHWQNRVAFV
jgi:hypothetical protein